MKIIPERDCFSIILYKLYPKRCNYFDLLTIFAAKSAITMMTNLSKQVKALRKQFGLTQEDLSAKAGVGLRFVRDLEQGKSTLRMDKVNAVLSLFGTELGVVPQQKGGDES